MRPVPASPRPDRLASGFSDVEEPRIFWVDASEGTVDTPYRAVGLLGYRVHSYSKATAALSTLAAEGVHRDVVVVNAGLNSLPGLWFVNALRSFGFPGKLIVLTDDPNPVVTLAFQDRFVDRILLQPVLPSTLRGSIEELFQPDWVPETSRSSVRS